MAKHRAAKKRRVLMAGAATVASAGMVLAGTSASAITAPEPKDCVSLVQALVTAQVVSDSKSSELRRAEQADKDARAVRDRAKTDAKTQYSDVDRPAAEKVPNDPATEKNETAVALQAALDKLNKAVADADAAYERGGTATALKRAQDSERDASGILAKVKLDIGKVCSTPPAPAPPVAPEVVERQVAPVPTIIESDLPVTH